MAGLAFHGSGWSFSAWSLLNGGVCREGWGIEAVTRDRTNLRTSVLKSVGYNSHLWDISTILEYLCTKSEQASYLLSSSYFSCTDKHRETGTRFSFVLAANAVCKTLCSETPSLHSRLQKMLHYNDMA